MKKYKIVRYKKKTLYSELEVVYLDQWPSWPRPRRLQCANQTRYPSFYIIPVAGTLSPPAGHYGNCSENGRRWTQHSSTRRILDEFSLLYVGVTLLNKEALIVPNGQH